MMSGDFQAKLRQCNRKLRIHAGNDPKRAAAIYDPADPELALVGIDKNLVPEYPVYDEKGHMLKGGWRRAIDILIKTGWVDKRRAEKVFRTEFHARGPKLKAYVDPIQKAMDDMYQRSKPVTVINEEGKQEFKLQPQVDDIVGVAQMIREAK